MTIWQKFSLTILRLSIGWLFLYSGFTKVGDSAWSSAGYLNSAKVLTDFYHWLASPGLLPLTNFMNEWGQLLLGISLILGFGVRLSGILGALLMLLYYLPILNFPYPNAHSYLVDEHIIYAAALLLLSAIRAGRTWGLDGLVTMRVPWLRKWFG